MTTPLIPVPKLGKHQLSLHSGIVIIEVNGILSLEEAARLMDYIHRCDMTEPNLGMLVLANDGFKLFFLTDGEIDHDDGFWAVLLGL